MTRKYRIGIVTGETSGDMLGAGLIEALKAHIPDLTIEGITGPKLNALGAISLFPIEKLSIIGIVEPLRHLPELLKIRRSLRDHFIKNPPDLFIGIDSPDFNLGLEKALKQVGIPVIHYVSPSVWAWRRWRWRKIAKAVDLMLTLFPFEADFYREHQIPVKYVGHPLADQIPVNSSKQSARAALGLSNQYPVIALLPGSRLGELKLHSELFLDTAAWCLQHHKELKFITAMANSKCEKYFTKILKEKNFNLPLKIYSGNAQQIMAAADVVMIASGTATLECALIKRPMVVCYRLSKLTYMIAKQLVKLQHIALPNLLAHKTLVPEFIQHDATVENIGPALLDYLQNPAKVINLQHEFDTIHQLLRRNANQQAAEAIIHLLQQKQINTRKLQHVNSTI